MGFLSNGTLFTIYDSKSYSVKTYLYFLRCITPHIMAATVTTTAAPMIQAMMIRDGTGRAVFSLFILVGRNTENIVK